MTSTTFRFHCRLPTLLASLGLSLLAAALSGCQPGLTDAQARSDFMQMYLDFYGSNLKCDPREAAKQTAAAQRDEIIDIIKHTVNSTSDPEVAAWTDEGGPATAGCYGGALMVTQTPHGLAKVGELLALLDRAKAIKADVKDPLLSTTAHLRFGNSGVDGSGWRPDFVAGGRSG